MRPVECVAVIGLGLLLLALLGVVAVMVDLIDWLVTS